MIAVSRAVYRKSSKSSSRGEDIQTQEVEHQDLLQVEPWRAKDVVVFSA